MPATRPTSLSFAHQQFIAAAQFLATSDEPLRQRVVLATRLFREMRREDFQGSLRERFIRLEKVLTGTEDQNSPAEMNEETITATMAGADDEKVAEAAERIFTMFLSLHRKLTKEDEEEE